MNIEKHHNELITKEMLEAYEREEVSLEELVEAGWDCVEIWEQESFLTGDYIGSAFIEDGELTQDDCGLGLIDPNNYGKIILKAVDCEKEEDNDGNVMWKVICDLVTNYSHKRSIPDPFLAK